MKELPKRSLEEATHYCRRCGSYWKRRDVGPAGGITCAWKPKCPRCIRTPLLRVLECVVCTQKFVLTKTARGLSDGLVQGETALTCSLFCKGFRRKQQRKERANPSAPNKDGQFFAREAVQRHRERKLREE